MFSHSAAPTLSRIAIGLLASTLLLACGNQEKSTEELTRLAAAGDEAAMQELEQRTVDTMKAMEKEKDAASEAPTGGIVPDDVAAAEQAAMLPYDMDKLRSLADDGSSHASYLLGKLLTSQGEPGAAEALEAAVKSDHLDATFLVGKSQLHGLKPFELNVEAGLALLEEASANGHGEAAFVLGVAHRYGQGVEVDEAAALTYYERAMQCGFIAAQDELNQLKKKAAGD
ncbi:MAG: tetratricopeptide repeat protein [Planctomycetota bacterium]